MSRLAAALLVGVSLSSCGGDASSNQPSSPSGGCASDSDCDQDPGTSTGASDGSGGGAAECTDATAAGEPAPGLRFANWPMPHPAGSNLPNEASYDTSRPDVVVDRVTGLMWQQTASGPHTFEEAASLCGELALDGFCDWRLPTRIELVSLVDITRNEPALDPVFVTDGTGALLSSSRSSVGDAPSRLNLNDGSTGGGSEGAVLCVRTHHANPAPDVRYAIEGGDEQETVTDLATGLVWQRHLGEQAHSFAAAPDYCATAELPGEGWRVPSMKELQTIIDESQGKESVLVDLEIFPDVSASDSFFWTSTREIGHEDSAWMIRFNIGQAVPLSRQITYLIDSELPVRCVR